MALPVLTLWNCVEGIVYMTSALILMAYPQITDLFNFSGTDFTSKDYKMCQVSAAALSVIGFFYLSHGLVPYCNAYIAPWILGAKYPRDNLSDIPVVFAYLTVFSRTTFVPLIIIIVLCTFARNTPMVQIIGVILLIVDPLFAIITWILLRKYAHQANEKETSTQ